MKCTLPHNERGELRDEVSVAQSKFAKNRAFLFQIFEVAAPDTSPAEIEAFEIYLELLLDAHSDLISAQNIAHSAGLMAEDE